MGQNSGSRSKFNVFGSTLLFESPYFILTQSITINQLHRRVHYRTATLSSEHWAYLCRFTIPVKTEDYSPDEGGEEGLFVLLRFTFTPTYPTKALLLEVEESENIEDEHLGRRGVSANIPYPLGPRMYSSVHHKELEEKKGFFLV